MVGGQEGELDIHKVCRALSTSPPQQRRLAVAAAGEARCFASPLCKECNVCTKKAIIAILLRTVCLLRHAAAQTMSRSSLRALKPRTQQWLCIAAHTRTNHLVQHAKLCSDTKFAFPVRFVMCMAERRGQALAALQHHCELSLAGSESVETSTHA